MIGTVNYVAELQRGIMMNHDALLILSLPGIITTRN